MQCCGFGFIWIWIRPFKWFRNPDPTPKQGQVKQWPFSSISDLHWFQCGSGSSILGQCGSGCRSGSKSRLLMIKNWNKLRAENITVEKKLIFFWSKIPSYLSLGLIKDIQATGGALSPEKRTSSISKLEISSIFLFLWVIFALLDPDPHSHYRSGSSRPK